MLNISDLFLLSLLEADCPYMDLTTDGMGIGNEDGQILCFPKMDGVVAGMTLAARLFVLQGVNAKVLVPEGSWVRAKTPILKVQGKAADLHRIYKVAQSLMEYVSGIANRARAMVNVAKVENPLIEVAMTRKHFPGTKELSLWGAMAGGASVHRLGLSDSILVFDQHRVFANDMDSAMKKLKAKNPEKKVAVEVDTLTEGLKYLALRADIIQCERFSIEDLSELVKIAQDEYPYALISAAGGLNDQNAQAYAQTGVGMLVTSWPYFGKPFDIKMAFSAN